MRTLLTLLTLAALAGFYGAASAQQNAPAPYVYTPPPQQPAARAAVPRAPAVVVPFGALYNVISGQQPSRRGQQPLTPFNAAPTAP